MGQAAPGTPAASEIRCAVRADGHILVAACSPEENSLRIWDADTGELLRELDDDEDGQQ